MRGARCDRGHISIELGQEHMGMCVKPLSQIGQFFSFFFQPALGIRAEVLFVYVDQPIVY